MIRYSVDIMKLLICLVTSIILLQILPIEEYLGITEAGFNPLNGLSHPKNPTENPTENPTDVENVLYVELVQSPYSREELVIKVKYLVDDIQLLKGLKDISRGYIYNSLNGWVIEARTPLSKDFDEWLEYVWNTAEDMSHFELQK